MAYLDQLWNVTSAAPPPVSQPKGHESMEIVSIKVVSCVDPHSLAVAAARARAHP